LLGYGFASPGALLIILYLHRQSAEAGDLQFDFFAVLQRAKAEVVGACGDDVAGVKRDFSRNLLDYFTH